MLRLVFRADRAQADRAALPQHLLFQLGRVWPNGEVLGAGRPGGADPDARIQRNGAFKIDDQRVDVKLGNLWNFGQQLRHRHQHMVQRVSINRRGVAPARQQAGHPGARHQRPGQWHVQRWQGHSPVGHDLDRSAALPEQDHRAKHRVNRAAHNQLLRMAALHHALHSKSLHPCLRQLLLYPRQHGGCGMAQGGLIGQVQGDTAHVRLMRNVIRQNLQHHRKAQCRGGLGGGVSRGCDALRGHHRDTAGLQHGLRLGLAQQGATGGQRGLHNLPDAGAVRALIGQHGGWRLRQLELVVAVAQQHGESAHRLLGRVKASNTGVLKGLACLRDGGITQPATHQPRRHVGVVLRQRHQGLGNVSAWHDGGGGVDEQQRPGVGVVIENAQRLLVARHRGVANDVHRVAVRPVGGQHGIELVPGGFAQGGQRHVGKGRSVGCHDAGATAVGQDGQAVAGVGAKARQGGGRQKQLLQRVDPQHAGAGNGRVKHQVRAGHRPGVRGCRQLA